MGPEYGKIEGLKELGSYGRRETTTENWNSLPWKDIQRNVFRLQQRIYQAARRNETKRVHDLQRLLLRSWCGVSWGSEFP